jgi:hypothetical protein
MLLQVNAAQLKLIIRVGPVANAMKPDFQGVRTHWNQGFMAFRKARRMRIVMLMIPVRLESGFADVWRRLRPGPAGLA